jgi:exodeoxyribonuclease V alpha subunit
VTWPSPLGAARARFLREAGQDPGADPAMLSFEEDDFEPAYLGWEIANAAPGFSGHEARAVAALSAALVGALRAGSTRLALDERRLAAALAGVGAADVLPTVRSLLRRVGSDAIGPAGAILGRPCDRKPLVVEDGWLSTERMQTLETRFCERVRLRVTGAPAAPETKASKRALAAVSGGPPPLTEEQKRAVREALRARLALVTGGPGSGKTTIIVALLRALLWMGVPAEAVAIAAPTGKAAHRLEEAIAAGLSSAPLDMAEAALRSRPPAPHTLHRLLGWSPGRGRFARHENDPLPHRVVVVDEASMVDLAMMDRLVRALKDDARLVLMGDADQLPSIEAGAVFRDLCAALGAVRLTTNLRVADDAGARRIVLAAQAVNAGKTDGGFAEAVATRRSVDELTWQGVEHLDARWADVHDAFLRHWWTTRVAVDASFVERSSRTYRFRQGAVEPEDAAELRALFQYPVRARILCATRARAFPASANSINDRLLAHLAEGSPSELGWSGRRRRAPELVPGAPVLVQRNDYERGLYNGDQGLVVHVDQGDATGPRPMAVFERPSGFDVFPLDAVGDLAPAFAMTVHKAQGSEFDHLALVLPEEDLPLVTRELVYTAITRARRSVILVGESHLLTRAVHRSVERFSGVQDRLRTL